jgi:hypothetical protein
MRNNIFRMTKNNLITVFLMFVLSLRVLSAEPPVNFEKQDPLLKKISGYGRVFDLFVAEDSQYGYIALIELTEKVNGSSFRYQGNIENTLVKLVWIARQQPGTRLQMVELPIDVSKIHQTAPESSFSNEKNYSHEQYWTLNGLSGAFKIETMTEFNQRTNKITLAIPNKSGSIKTAVSFVRASGETSVAKIKNHWTLFRDFLRSVMGAYKDSGQQIVFGTFAEPKLADLVLAHPDGQALSPARNYLSFLNARNIPMTIVALDIPVAQRPSALAEFSMLLLTIPTATHPDAIDLSKIKIVGVQSDGAVVESYQSKVLNEWTLSGQTVNNVYTEFDAGDKIAYLRFSGDTILQALRNSSSKANKYGRVLTVPKFSGKDSIDFILEVSGDSKEYPSKLIGDSDSFDQILDSSFKSVEKSKRHPILRLLKKVGQDHRKLMCLKLFE